MRIVAAWLLALMVSVTTGSDAQPPGQNAVMQAIALGRRCVAPIVKLSSPRGDFDGYIETPTARIALVAATATVMHATLDAPGAKRAMRPGYRIWFERKPSVPATLTIARVSVRDGSGREWRPEREENERLFLGTVPSHGIAEAFRRRFPEYVFSALPSGRLTVLVATTHGTERYAAVDVDRAPAIRVCN